MADTPRNLADLQDILDDNITGEISPQDLRDFLVSAALQTEDADFDTHSVSAAEVITPAISSHASTPTDLTVDCGTEKTLVLAEPCYNDCNIGGLTVRTGATAPTTTQIVDNLGANTGIYAAGFDVGDEGSGVLELIHDYKEGTDITFHIHWGANDAPSGTDYVRWKLTYSVARSGSTFPPVASLEVETAHSVRYDTHISSFSAITGTNFKIGDQLNFTIKRITPSDHPSDGFAGRALAQTIGYHYQVDTLGSRKISTK